MVWDHSIIKEGPNAPPLSTQGPSQSDPSPLELSPFHLNALIFHPALRAILFVVRTILPWQWMEITIFIACVYLIVVQIQGGTILLLLQQFIIIVGLKVTHTRFFLVMCLSIICIVYVSLLLLAGDIESNPGPSENKREASGEPGGNPPRNKKRKGEKVDSEEDIDCTVIRLTEQPLTYKVL